MNNDLTNLERTLLRLKKADYSLCNTDTLIRVGGPQENLCDCTRCVFNDTKELPFLGCPHGWGYLTLK